MRNPTIEGFDSHFQKKNNILNFFENKKYIVVALSKGGIFIYDPPLSGLGSVFLFKFF